MSPRPLRLLGVLLILLPACIAPRQNVGKADTPEPAAADDTEGFSLILNNRHYLDVNVFVQHDGQASRVGTVTGSSSQSMMLPRWMLGQTRVVRIIAEPIGDETRYTTENLTVQPGQVVELNVESTISRSNYSVQ
jgi:hypothetical protein